MTRSQRAQVIRRGHEKENRMKHARRGSERNNARKATFKEVKTGF